MKKLLKLTLKKGDGTAEEIVCKPTPIISFSNAPKTRKGVITEVTEKESGNTYIEFASTEANRSRQEGFIEVYGHGLPWAVVGTEIKYKTEE